MIEYTWKVLELFADNDQLISVRYLLTGTDGINTVESEGKHELDALWESTQATIISREQAAKDIKESALAKLAALGLTQDEVKALSG